MEIELNIKKNEVLEEVAKTSAYSGSKMTEDEGAYERIFTTDADREMLERFWSESQVAVCEAMKKFLADEGETDDGYTVSLELSKSFDDVLQGSMEKELFSFFVMNITAKWFAFTNKKEAGDYGSNNLYSWHVVWSSRDHFLRGFRGTPYKYFRLVLVCNLQKDERIYGFTTSYTPRLTNRPR
jgi:hypothetical protein